MKRTVTALFFLLAVWASAQGQAPPPGGVPYYQRQLRHGTGLNRGWIDDSLDALKARMVGVSGGLTQSQANALYRGKMESTPINLISGLPDSLAAKLSRAEYQAAISGAASTTNTYTVQQANSIFAQKATTLAGYGITNGATSTDLLSAVATRVQFTASVTSLQAMAGVTNGTVVTVLDLKRGGTFVYYPTGYTVDNGTVFPSANGGFFVLQINNNTYRPEMWGAVGDSLTDDTQAVKLCLAAAGKRTVLFTGRYRVTTGQITVPSDVMLTGQNGGRILTNSTTGNVLNLSNSRNVRFDNVDFGGPSGDVKDIYTSYAQNLTFSGVDCRLIGFLRAENSQYLTIAQCTGSNSYSNVATRGSAACLDLALTSHVTVDGCDFSNYNFGVLAYGGEGNPITSANGVTPIVRTPVALTVARGASDITVRNTTANNTFAGIWATMVKDFRVINSTAEVAADVGIDAEACVNVLFDGCTVRDATNGGFTTFFINDNVVWRNLNSYVTTAGKLPFAFFGGAQGQSGKISISTLRAYSTLAVTGGYQDGSYRDINVTSSYFENVTPQFHNVAGHRQTITGNELVNTLSGTPVSLYAGNVVPLNGLTPSLTISANRFTNRYGLTNGAIGQGFQVFHQPNVVTETIEANETRGYQLDIVLQPQDNTNSANRATVNLQSNVFGAGQVYLPTPQAGRLALNVLLDDRNNRDGAGNAIGANATAAGLALKAPVASPVFTGVPTAPTAATGTATTQVATTQFVQQAVAGVSSAQPNDSIFVLSPGNVLTKYRAILAGTVSVTTGTTSTTGLYGAQQQVNAPEFDTTGLNMKVVLISPTTQAAYNSARDANIGQSNVYLKFDAPGSIATTRGINLGGNGNTITNWLIHGGGTDATGTNSVTITNGNNNIGLINLYNANFRGLTITGFTIIHNGTTSAGEAATPNNYGVVAQYEDASIQGVTLNNKFISGLRFRRIRGSCPNMDKDFFFGNTTGGNGQGKVHRDVTYEDLNLGPCASAGIEILAHKWDYNFDTTTVEAINYCFRRIRYNNLGQGSGKTPKFGPCVSLSGKNSISLYQDILGTNPTYSGVENVGGSQVTSDGISSPVTTGNATAISMTNNKGIDISHRVTVRNVSHTVTGAGTGRIIELNRVSHALVQNVIGIGGYSANFRTYTTLIGSLTGATGQANSFSTLSGSAVSFQNETKDTYFQYNTVSNENATGPAQTIEITRDPTTDGTLRNFIRYNTIRRANGSINAIKFYGNPGGTDFTSAVSNTNTLTPNTITP